MILNRQRNVRIPVPVLDVFVAQACKLLRLCPEAVTICLVTNSEMARWNRTYRGKNRATDVLSFPVEARKKPAKASGSQKLVGPSKQPATLSDHFSSVSNDYIGDIAIAPAVARRNAQALGRTLGDEMRILILHGILHLMGYDHETDTGQMERREKRLRRALGLD